MEEAKSSKTRDVSNTSNRSWGQPREIDIVYDRGAYVLDVDVNDGVYVNDERRQSGSDSGITFPVIRNEYWELALSQAHRVMREISQLNRTSMVRIKTRMSRSRSRYHQSLMSPRKRSVIHTKPHIVLSVFGVRSASRPRALTQKTRNGWGTRNILQ